MATNLKSKTLTLEAKHEKEDYVLSYKKLKGIYMDLECKRAKKYEPSSTEVQVLVDKYMHHLSSHHNYNLDAFRELANFYAVDDSLKAYLNSYGDGFSEFLSKAIKFYCA